ncbi:MAG: hypothetical protein IJX98_03300, partial [Clostridia bacterium]|nr:hypothetical protein [Clostridia bacterium]
MAQQKKQKPSAFQQELLEIKEKREHEQMIEQRKQRIEDNRNKLSAKMTEAVDKYIDYMEQYGEDDMRTRFQAMTIMLIEPLNQVIDVMLALEETMLMIDDALGVVEETMGIIEKIMDPKHRKKVGFFGRLISKMRMRRYMGAWKGRIKQLGAIMGEMMKGTEEITRSITSMMGSMSNTKGGGTGVGLNSKARQLVEQR